jgi:hypothetical protein
MPVAMPPADDFCPPALVYAIAMRCICLSLPRQASRRRRRVDTRSAFVFAASDNIYMRMSFVRFSAYFPRQRKIFSAEFSLSGLPLFFDSISAFEYSSALSSLSPSPIYRHAV